LSKKTKTTPTARPSGSQSIRLELSRPQAREVFVAGSFNDWQTTATPLTPAGEGKWVVELALPPGRYEYRFIADGDWVDDPSAKEVVPNPHGGANALLVVPPT
jgi:1,4-alpha-glucan branching enzyme